MSGETKVCPVCDSVIDADARRCSECNTDLSLFDVDSDLDKAPSPNGKSLDDILKSIVAGKDVRPDLFEDIKTIATDGSSGGEEDILSDTEVETGVEFECPNCGARVGSDAKQCPSCGAEFADDAVEQFECPLCNAIVDSTATSCPNCGVAFAEDSPAPPARPAPPATRANPSSRPGTPVTARVSAGDELELEIAPPPVARPSTQAAKPAGPSPMERLWSIVESRRVPPENDPLDKATLYRELPRLVNEVKPLLLTAKKVGVEIGAEKDLISEAIAYGKKRDVERAVTLIRKARFQLENAFTSQIAKRIEALLLEAERSRATGGDAGAIIRMCNEAIRSLEERDYASAGDGVKAAKEEFEARSGGYAKARQELATIKELAADTKKVGLNLREVDAFLSRADAAMAAKNHDQAAGYAVQARQALLKALPEVLSKEMKKARNALLDMKVKGGDLTKPVGLLKQASIHIKREEYADAVKFVRMFQDEVGKF
ncbi:MAG TPA: zinc ribbon domain-containing protein [Thermoplasmata archaeon]|nr:zinc ribbon domain-containing protein [Thermoplasmata archaeon]